jgi:hypothetical protein
MEPCRIAFRTIYSRQGNVSGGARSTNPLIEPGPQRPFGKHQRWRVPWRLHGSEKELEHFLVTKNPKIRLAIHNTVP